MINLRFSSQQRLTQLIKLMGVELAERRMVAAHKGQRLVHRPVNHRAVIVKGIVQVKRQRGNLAQRSVKTHYFPV